MSFLNNNNSEFLSARITKKGRKSISEGDFVIKYFQIGDSEFDYNFNNMTGNNNAMTSNYRAPYQRVFSPSDGDTQVKYPFILSDANGQTYGDPVRNSTFETVRNEMGPAGFVTQYYEYDDVYFTGTTIACAVQEVSLGVIDGTSILTVENGLEFTTTEFITLALNTRLVGDDQVITGETQTLVYRVISVNGNELNLDRNLPDFSDLNGYAQVICNDCKIEYPLPTEASIVCSPILVDNLDQHDPWTLDIVWTQKPAGVELIDEQLSGYTGNQYASTKEYLGYTTSSGQTITNLTGGTISNPTAFINSYDETVNVLPEDQRCIAIVHFSELGDIYNDKDRFYRYDDRISGDVEDIDTFEVYIPFVHYHRNTSNVIGALFTMDSTDYYVSSSKNLKPNSNNVKFRYLLDEQEVRVGKVFLDKKIIVFDDQELVAMLEYKSNRRYTLPAPKVAVTATDSPCMLSVEPLITTGQTAWITYVFEYDTNPGVNGMHCNYYNKITGTTNSNVTMKFNTGSFGYMDTSSFFDGFIADKFYALAQVTTTGNQPSSESWKLIDLTDQILSHTPGNLIDPTNLTNIPFTITGDEYDSAPIYDIENFLGPITNQTDAVINPTLSDFGDTQPFPGYVRLTRATDIAVLNYMINLPSTQFNTSQNPTYKNGNLRITDIALLNEQKEALVIAKCTKPVERSGTQVFSVRLDF